MNKLKIVVLLLCSFGLFFLPSQIGSDMIYGIFCFLSISYAVYAGRQIYQERRNRLLSKKTEGQSEEEEPLTLQVENTVQNTDEIQNELPESDKRFSTMIEKILEENYQDSRFNITRFAELSGTHRTVFFKRVKECTGYCPNELIKMKRMNRAAEMLRQGDYSIAEVSYNVGFEDPYYFSKCFKAYFDCTPKNYKAINLVMG